MKNYGAIISVSQEGDVCVVEMLAEEILEEVTINNLTESLFSLIAERPKVQLLLSFAHVKHFSSSLLGTLIRLSKRVEEREGQLKLCEISPSLYEVFVITKLNKLFAIYQEREIALQSFEQ